MMAEIRRYYKQVCLESSLEEKILDQNLVSDIQKLAS